MSRTENYIVDSRHYLARARRRLDERRPASLFYAAFELRCGVESRMQEYLSAQDHISNSRKKGWQIDKLGHNVENAFKLGDKIAEVSMRDKASGGVIFRVYYTPVTRALRKKAESLNTYMHAQEKHHPLNSSWWNDFRALLEGVCSDLALANKGTLLGPPLLNRKTGQIKMQIEMPEGNDSHCQKVKSTVRNGADHIVEVQYYEEFPA